jgi:hypothetical protein
LPNRITILFNRKMIDVAAQQVSPQRNPARYWHVGAVERSGSGFSKFFVNQASCGLKSALLRFRKRTFFTRQSAAESWRIFRTPRALDNPFDEPFRYARSNGPAVRYLARAIVVITFFIPNH